MFNLTKEQQLTCNVLKRALSTQEVEPFQHLVANEQVLVWLVSNELSSCLAFEFAQVHGWKAVPSPWVQIYDNTKSRIDSYLSELDRTATHLAASGISLVALKNSGIARGIFPYPGAVPMGDIDVLVRKQDFRKTHTILTENGFSLSIKPPLKEDDFISAELAGVAEYKKKLPNDLILELELHWRPITGRWIRPEQEPSADELIERSIPIPGTDVRLLSPEDNLLQVSLHTARHSYVRAPGFRLHLDVERIVRAYPDLDWQVFLNRTRQLQVKTAVYFSLLIPKELFETPIPDWVLDELRPPRWKEAQIVRMIQKAGLFNPHEQKFSKAAYVLFNALLYDDFSGLWRGVFPEREWMRQHYQIRNPLLLPYYHLHRIGGLLFRRLKT